jgi:hypothetical protein
LHQIPIRAPMQANNRGKHFALEIPLCPYQHIVKKTQGSSF